MAEDCEGIMKTEGIRECSTCAFYFDLGDERNEGRCQRKPPVQSIAPFPTPTNPSANLSRAWQFPIVVSDDWCGEWIYIWRPKDWTTDWRVGKWVIDEE